jgi:hypothetical protein
VTIRVLDGVKEGATDHFSITKWIVF